MSTSVRILSISDDDGLRYSRELLLLNDGYYAESITSNAALSVTRVRSFDIAIICRSVQAQRAMALIDKLRRYHPEIQIVSISPLENQAEPCEADIQIPSGPERILDAVRQLGTQISMRKACYEPSHHGRECFGTRGFFPNSRSVGSRCGYGGLGNAHHAPLAPELESK